MEEQRIDISKYENNFSVVNKLGRVLWSIVRILFFRFSPTRCFCYRRILLRMFGAKIGKRADVYPSVRIWAPWNLEMGDYSCMSHYVDCYCVDKIRIGSNATVSQYSHLCTATHDIGDPHMKLETRPINIDDGAWACAGVFVGPGVTMGKGAVAGARSVVVKDVEAWTVVAGNPARETGKRGIRS